MFRKSSGKSFFIPHFPKLDKISEDESTRGDTRKKRKTAVNQGSGDAEVWRKIGLRGIRGEVRRGDGRIWLGHNNQPPLGVGITWWSAVVTLRERMRSADSDKTRVDVEARGGRGKARVLFAPGFFGGVIVFLLFFVL